MLKVKKLKENAIIPTRGTSESAGLDLYALLESPAEIKPREIVMISTGFAIELMKGTAGFIFGRSSLGAKHGICPANAVGVIDSDYRGEIKVSLINNSNESYTINPGDRIAQLVIMKVELPEVLQCDDLSESERGSGGFGSTGK